MHSGKIISKKSTSPMPSITWQGVGLMARAYVAYVRHVPNHPVKVRVARCLGRVLFPDGILLSCELGAKVKVSPIDFIGRALCFEGGYETQSLSLALRLMAEGGLFLDVGTYFGLYTFLLGTLPGVRCISIDASPLAMTQFLRNYRLNPQVVAMPIQAALGTDREIKKLIIPYHGNLGMTRISAQKAEGETNFMYVGGSTLQAVLDAVELSPIKLLKIDVEGFELNVLRSLDWSGAYRPHNVIIEFSEGVSDEFKKNSECFKFLLDAGYSAHTVLGNPVADWHSLPEENCWFIDDRH
jgi:FkbM family methyltransferase